MSFKINTDLKKKLKRYCKSNSMTEGEAIRKFIEENIKILSE